MTTKGKPYRFFTNDLRSQLQLIQKSMSGEVVLTDEEKKFLAESLEQVTQLRYSSYINDLEVAVFG